MQPEGQPVSYSRREVLRLLGLKESVLESWEQHGFVAPCDNYGFRDLVALKSLQQLRRNRIRPDRIHEILATLRRKLAHVSNPLSELKIYTGERRVSVQVDGKKMEALSGQLLLDFDEAELKRLLEFPVRQSSSPGLSESTLLEAERWFEKGVEAEQSGRPPDEAVQAYRECLKLDSKQASALVNLGTIHYNQSQWTEAEDCYLRALAARPAYALAHFNLGNLYDELGQWHKALEQYLAALAASPGHADTHYNLALLYQNHGEPLKAVMHWRSYLKADPQGYWAAIARRELAKLREKTLVSSSTS